MIIPKQKDIIFIDYEPHSGKEYGGHDKKNIRRPMVVLSNNAYNEKTGLIIGMPITTAHKSNNQLYKQIIIPNSLGKGVNGFIVLWQVQNFDYRSRNAEIVGSVSDKIFKELLKAHSQIFEKV